MNYINTIKFISIILLIGTNKLCMALENENKLIIHASEMQFSKNVSNVDDHIVIWGLGPDRYAWVAYPISSVPFSTFIMEAEVAADTAANRWPIIAIAFNDSSNLQMENQVSSINWQQVYLGQFTPDATDLLVYFVFKNDYYNPRKQQDLNLRIRNIIFRKVEVHYKSVKVSWLPNTEPFLGGYIIYYGTASKKYSNHIDVGLVTEKELSLAVNKTYYFVITAYSKTTRYESLPSDEVIFKHEGDTLNSQRSKNVFGEGQPISENLAMHVLPEDFSLAQNYPNPFNQTTNVGYTLPELSRVNLLVYNLLGQQVRTLVKDKMQSADVYEIKWNGKDDSDRLVSSGVYFYRLQAGEFVQTCKMLMLR